MSIKTNFEIPRAADDNDIVKQGQRLSQDLSKNFKAIRKELDNLVGQSNPLTSGINGVSFSSSYSFVVVTGSTTSTTVTFTHNFGSIPTGFIVVDLTSSNTVYLTQPIITRDSWTTTQITVRISVTSIDFGSNRTQSGTFKIIVLR
jgi:hypothetical protein